MAAMEAVLAARRTAVEHPAEPSMARGPGGDLRFSVRTPPSAQVCEPPMLHWKGSLNSVSTPGATCISQCGLRLPHNLRTTNVALKG